MPTTSLTASGVYSADATAIAAVTYLYDAMSKGIDTSPGGITSLNLFAALSADELNLWSGMPGLTASAYFRNALTGYSNGVGGEFWDGLYPIILTCNSALHALDVSSTLTPAIRQQLVGEAKFVRAFLYFYLVNLFGEVAMPLNADAQVNSLLPRTPVTNVYRQIIADLQDAAANMNTRYLDGSLLNTSIERVRPTRWAALALLSRVALYTGDWPGAERYADTVIANAGLFTLGDLNATFLRTGLGNKEAIWQLQPVNMGWNTEEAKVFIMPASGPGSNGYNAGVYLSSSLLAAFEPGDLRRVNWVDSAVVGTTTYYFPYKYKVNTFGAAVTEYSTLLRLGELYLIRAEARAMQGELIDAAADLNTIRARAGLGPTSAATQQALLQAVQHERQVELFTEFGARWLDLKRTKAVDSVMAVVTPLKGGGAWNSYQQLYPVPPGDLNLDPNMMQNPGY
jgi:hypothetical protein